MDYNTGNNPEPKAPYYSVRVRIGDVVSPKAWIGYKERSVEVTYGNMMIRKTGEVDKLDIGAEETRTLKEELQDAFKQTDALARERKFKYVDEVKKNDKGEPLLE
jgi:hypothetical protein